MIEIKEAMKIILNEVKGEKVETIALTQSFGRVLAEDVYSIRDNPPYDVSAMDGYALKSSSLENATKDKPLILKNMKDIKAGEIVEIDIKENECVRIMTGAKVPSSCDSVVRQEDTVEDGDNVKFFSPSKYGKDIRIKGEHLKKEDLMLSKGVNISVPEYSLLSLAKKSKVSVFVKPSVSVLSCGDELEDIDDEFDENKIPDSNSHMLIANLLNLNLNPENIGIATDDENDLRSKLEKGLVGDVLIVSGGTSVGKYDMVRPELEKIGVKFLFWKINIKPGKPMAFGVLKDKLVFCLPGNPVSAYVCFNEFVVPALRKFMGAADIYKKTISVKAGEDITSKGSRTNLFRVHFEENEQREVSAFISGNQSSAMLTSMNEADGLLIANVENRTIKKGDNVFVRLFKENEFMENLIL